MESDTEPKISRFSSGPFLAAALFCEKTLEEKDGVMSLIRVVDRIQIVAEGPTVPQTMPSVTVPLIAFLAFKSGAARGRHMVKLVPETPSGLKLPMREMPVLFEGDDRGANLIFQINLVADQEGVYWIWVYLEDELVTKMPYRITYMPRSSHTGSRPS